MFCALPCGSLLADLIDGAAERKEILHFVSAREMANIILAEPYGRVCNPGDDRDYRYQLRQASVRPNSATEIPALPVRG